MKGLKKKLEAVKGDTDLKDYVVNDIIDKGGNEERECYIKDILNHGCVSGLVGALIYYADTHKFFDEHYDDIMEIASNYEEGTGLNLHHDGDMKNWYAWFAFEETVRQVADEIGMEI